MTTLSFIPTIAYGLGQYNSSRIASNIIKTGKDHIVLGMHLATRLFLTTIQLGVIVPPAIRKYRMLSFCIPLAIYQKDPLLKYQAGAIAALRLKIGNLAEQLCQHSDKIIHALTLTSCVALTAMGFHIHAGIVFTSLLLTVAKQGNLLPEIADKYLGEMAELCHYISLLISNLPLPFKAFFLISALNSTLSHFHLFDKINVDPVPLKHIENQTFDLSLVLSCLHSYKFFILNPSYIFSEEAEQAISTTSNNDVSQENPIKPYKLSIHLILSRWREEQLIKSIKNYTNLSEDKNSLMLIHRALWNILRTPESEMIRKVTPFTPLENVMFRYFCSRNSFFGITISELVVHQYIQQQLLKLSPVSGMSMMINSPVKAIDKAIARSESILRMESVIQDGFIDSALIEEWKQDFQQRRQQEVPKYCFETVDGTTKLSSMGVLLLLWDMSIIKGLLSGLSATEN